MFRFVLFSLCLLALTLRTERASAEFITFTFSGTAGPVHSLDFTAPGTSFPSPIIHATASATNGGVLFQGLDGLGNSTDSDAPTNRHLVDNENGDDEFIDLLLTSLGGYASVDLLSVTFRAIEPAEDDILAITPAGATIFVNTGAAVGGEFTFNFPSPEPYPLNGLLRLMPLTNSPNFNDDFTVYSMTVDAQSPVPEPASIAVWSVLGLMGAGLAWRRKRRHE
jgi:hypothetical protein